MKTKILAFGAGLLILLSLNGSALQETAGQTSTADQTKSKSSGKKSHHKHGGKKSKKSSSSSGDPTSGSSEKNKGDSPGNEGGRKSAAPTPTPK
jgi:hypothetical protein